MGLTIGYKLSARRPQNLAGVRKLIEPLQDAARRLRFEQVGGLVQITPEYLGQYRLPRGKRDCPFRELLPPLEGWVFSATPGDGSESVEIGLCRHEGWPGWRWRDGCKTQYAARHGWEHFRDCHRRVIELLWAAEERGGLRVKVDDEGGLWEHGSEMTLRRRLAGYDRTVAAFGGMLKDAAESVGERVHGPIFDDPRFERLEAEGRAELDPSLTEALRRLPLP